MKLKFYLTLPLLLCACSHTQKVPVEHIEATPKVTWEDSEVVAGIYDATHKTLLIMTPVEMVEVLDAAAGRKEQKELDAYPPKP